MARPKNFAANTMVTELKGLDTHEAARRLADYFHETARRKRFVNIHTADLAMAATLMKELLDEADTE